MQKSLPIRLLLCLAMLLSALAPVQAVENSQPAVQDKASDYTYYTFDPAAPANDLEPSPEEFVPIDGGTLKIGGEPLQEETIPVSRDQRELVTDTAHMPYSAVCKLNMYFETPDGKTETYCGSGFMISENCMLTAAHCLYDTENGSRLTRLTVMPGQNSDQSPYGVYDSADGEVEGYYVNDAYLSVQGDDHFTWDLAIVTLNSPVGRQTGWFRLSTGGPSADQVRVLGYPYEYKNQIVEYSPYQSSGAVFDSSPIDRMLLFAAQGSGGQSGAPVLNPEGEAVAVFSCGMVDDTTDIDTGEYGGTLIDSERIHEITGNVPLDQPVYRAYNPNTGEHFYTRSYRELTFICSAGWKDEGLAWRTATEDAVKVWRLYDPNRGDHHYTSSLEERSALIRFGWIDEGVSWYAPSSNPYQTIYRLYNPNAQTGQHHFTTSIKERDVLIGYGWKDEGEAFDCL